MPTEDQYLYNKSWEITRKNYYFQNMGQKCTILTWHVKQMMKLQNIDKFMT